jgi:hypothetical protein
MSLSLDSTAQARSASTVRGAHWLIQLDFTTGTMYATTWPHDLVISGQTYSAINVDVADVGESENGSADKVTLSISIVNQAMLALTLGSLDTYRGRKVRLYVQFFDDTFQPVGAAVHYWTGRMEPARVVREVNDDGSLGRIELPCNRAGVSRARNADGLRISDAQQQALYAGDKGYEYIQTLVDKPATWLTIPFLKSA